MAEKLYQCRNSACSLGAVDHPGHFTGGATREFKNMLTGQPVEEMEEGRDYGEGVCPNCGKPGKDYGTHKSVAGDDPNQKIHDQVAFRVADESNESVTAENAQEEFEKLLSHQQFAKGADKS